MSKCIFCGNEFDATAYHLVYAFVGVGADALANELCPKHTDEFIESMETMKMDYRRLEQ